MRATRKWSSLLARTLPTCDRPARSTCTGTTGVCGGREGGDLDARYSAVSRSSALRMADSLIGLEQGADSWVRRAHQGTAFPPSAPGREKIDHYWIRTCILMQKCA